MACGQGQGTDRSHRKPSAFTYIILIVVADGHHGARAPLDRDWFQIWISRCGSWFAAVRRRDTVWGPARGGARRMRMRSTSPNISLRLEPFPPMQIQSRRGRPGSDRTVRGVIVSTRIFLPKVEYDIQRPRIRIDLSKRTIALIFYFSKVEIDREK